ncbi:DUF6479 family protein [Streptomyces sp. NPDC090056]
MSVCASGSTPFTNAAALWQTGLAQASVGFVVAVIIGAFPLGAMISDEELSPPTPPPSHIVPRSTGDPAGRRSTGTPSGRRSRARRADSGRTRLLGGRTETSPEPPTEERRR